VLCTSPHPIPLPEEREFRSALRAPFTHHSRCFDERFASLTPTLSPWEGSADAERSSVVWIARASITLSLGERDRVRGSLRQQRWLDAARIA